MGPGRHKPPCSDDLWPTGEPSFATQEKSFEVLRFRSTSVPALGSSKQPTTPRLRGWNLKALLFWKFQMQQIHTNPTVQLFQRSHFLSFRATGAPLQREAIGPAPHSSEVLGWWPGGAQADGIAEARLMSYLGCRPIQIQKTNATHSNGIQSATIEGIILQLNQRESGDHSFLLMQQPGICEMSR